MTITEAQREIRTHYVGGFYGQLVSAVLWFVSAALATWSTAGAAITALVVGGFFIFPLTTLLVRLAEPVRPMGEENTLPQLGMQVAFVLPLTMPLLLPVGLYRLEWFYPAMMILLGAHYLPFVFLYGMRMFAVLAGVLVVAGMMVAMYASGGFATGAWFTGAVLLLFAFAGRATVAPELRGGHA